MTARDCDLPGCGKAAREGEVTCYLHRRVTCSSSGSWMGEGGHRREVERDAALADNAMLAAERDDLDTAIDRVRRRHPRGDEEPGPTWPNPADPKLVQWRLRYGTPSRSDLLVAASFMHAYAHLIDLPRRERDQRIAQIRSEVTK